MELNFKKLVFLLFIIEFSYAITPPRNIVVYEGRSNFSFFCSAEGDSDKIEKTGYAPKKPLGNSRLLLADETDVFEDQEYRYSMNQIGKNRTIYYTTTTEIYDDNAYHDCVIGDQGFRAVVTVLCK